MNLRTSGTKSPLSLLFFASLPLVVGCGSGGGSSPGTGGVTGSGGAGTGGAVGSGGAGTGGAVGSGGTGTGGAVGSGGAGTGGTGTGGDSTGGSGNAGRSGGGAGGTAGAGAGGMAGGAGTAGRSGSAGAGGRGGSAGAGSAGTFIVTTPAFISQAGCGPAAGAASCATFPRNNTNYGTNISPAISWTGAPAGTQSFAVVLQDLTNGNSHWVLWNIPATVTMLAENVPKTSAMPATPAGSQQCNLGAGDGYFGPGACGNVYEFLVYALSIPTFAPTTPTDQTAVRAQLRALTTILGTASMRARTLAPNCP